MKLGLRNTKHDQSSFPIIYVRMLISPYPGLLPKDGIDSVVRKRVLFMRRIASLFLLQRLKGSMSGDARDFNNIETLAVIKFHFCVARRRRKFTTF